jgi:hypothetical protein
MATAHRPRSVTAAIFACAIFALIAGRTSGRADSPWTPLVNAAPDAAGTMLLLTDGTVMIQGRTPGNNWMRLTPDSAGSYTNGSWSVLAPMSIPRLYFASHVLPNGMVWVLGGEYSGFGLMPNATNTGEIYDPLSDSWSPIAPHPEAHFGDDPSMLLPGGKILAGSISSPRTYIYDIATNTWAFEALKVYDDSSDEEGWVKLPGNKVLTYDIFRSVATLSGYAEIYDPAAHVWSSVSPGDGSAAGVIPQLSSPDVGFEMGPALRLRGGGIFVIGATGHTARYNPSTTRWREGPDIVGQLNGRPALFGADDAPSAMLPNGHVLFAADAGPSAVFTTGNTALGSPLITAVGATSSVQPGWNVAGPGIPAGSRIVSVDSPTQVRISNNATATNTGALLKFGGVFSSPTQLFDFDPGANTIVLVDMPATSLSRLPAFVTRMLVLPTGQVLFSDGSSQLWVYTPPGEPPPGARPIVNRVTYDGNGVFLLKGRKLTGQSSGAAYGDDVENDENYPIVRLSSCNAALQSGQNSATSPETACTLGSPVFYARTTDWSSVDVGTHGERQTVSFRLPAGIPAGWYALEAIAAGVSSLPIDIQVTDAEITGQ